MEMTTERLKMREFVESDWQAVLAYQNNPLYLRYYEWTGRTPDEVRAFIQMFLDHQQESPRCKFQLAVTLKTTGELIGNCGIRLRAASAHEADIGYELDPRHWGQGYASEAARAIVAFGFNELELHRIWSWCVADNLASAHVLEKLGMRLEGRLRENEYYKGRWWDTLMYGMLDREWRAQSQLPSSWTATQAGLTTDSASP
jgi:[ribosomal protein S5]-alanine N-acetyltransferase